MKVNKYFMLGLAGLAFAACSNEEEINGSSNLDGNGAVSIKIMNPAVTRTVEGTQGDNDGEVKIKGDLTVTLTYDGGKTAHITINVEKISSATELKFWNITNPTKVEASINGGLGDYSNVQIDAATPNMQAIPEKIPAYGVAEQKDITLTNESGTPDLNNQYDGADKTTNGNTETGATEGDDKKTYQMYSAEIKMEIPVARLEISGITHVDEGTTCKFTTLTIDGVYMDNLYATGSATSTTGYYWGTDASDNPIGIGKEEAILKETITSTSFLKGNEASAPVFPTETNKVYAFNFYPGPTNPTFKIYFANAEAADASSPILAPRYAMISKYVQNEGDTDGIELVAGKIYRIKKAELKDNNIIDNENGEPLVYGLTVTVEEATWKISDISAVWEKY